MMGRWSRFAIGVNGTSINLHLYCQQNYAREEYKRSYSRLKFMEDSYLLVGHGGDIFNEQFKVSVLIEKGPSSSKIIFISRLLLWIPGVQQYHFIICELSNNRLSNNVKYLFVMGRIFNTIVLPFPKAVCSTVQSPYIGLYWGLLQHNPSFLRCAQNGHCKK